MYLYGAKGHGKVVKEILESNGVAVEAFIDDNKSLDNEGSIPVKHSVGNLGGGYYNQYW